MIEKDISQYLSLEQRARNLFGENYDLENCVEELRQYRRLTDRVKAIYGDQMTLKIMVDAMENVIRDPGYKHPVIARILTCNEAVMWDEYRKVGTPEECREAVTKQKAKTPDFEADGYYCGELVYDTWICPGCGEHYEIDYDKHEYCPCCGQRIDWSDYERED